MVPDLFKDVVLEARGLTQTLPRWPRQIVFGMTGAGKTQVLSGIVSSLLAQRAGASHQRVLIISTSGVEFSTSLATFSSERWRGDLWQLAPSKASTPCVKRMLAWTAVRTSDARLRAGGMAPSHAPIPYLVDRIVRTSRRGLSIREIVAQVHATELRRLARLERLLVVSLRRLLERGPAHFPEDERRPSKAASTFRLPLTGAQTLTAPPAAA